MSRRLTADREGAGAVLSLRLSAELAAGLERVRAELTATAAGLAASSPGLLAAGMLHRPSPSDAARALLTEALAARVSRDIANATARAMTPDDNARAYRTESQALRAHAPEGPCPTCGAGVWHPCSLCRARTRTCDCTVARDGKCEACALAPVATTPVAVDLIVTARRPDAPAVRAQLLALQASDATAWSCRAVGEVAGVSKNVVNAIMRGKNVLPKSLALVAAVLP